MRALAAMVNENLPALLECRRPELSIKSILDQLLSELNPEENEDEINMCKELLDRVFYDADINQER